MGSKIRKHMLVDGMVQGVGFRYRSYYTAQVSGLTGYVRNLNDGRVELELQGDQNQVDSFLDKVEASYFICITNVISKYMETDPNEISFQIKDSEE